MKENLQTEQILELDEEQLAAICGGTLADSTKSMNEALHKGDGMGHGAEQAQVSQNFIRKNAEAGKTFDVGNGWADKVSAKTKR